MKGFVLAAGLGTRLKPWTDSHPKALVPVGGLPMLQRVVEKMQSAGITDITVNVHHFASQIRDFIKNKGWNINISDESDCLLETGGGILHASALLDGDEPVIVHNVDILSDISFNELEEAHISSGADATLLVSPRTSTRKLIFDKDLRLKGWHSVKEGIFKPAQLHPLESDIELAFSGIYVISPSVIRAMKEMGWHGKFSIMDFLLASLDTMRYQAYYKENLNLLDIGKPDSLNRANTFFDS